MTDWETTKIKGDVKARAKEDPRTYTEIMAAGLNSDSGLSDASPISEKVVQELRDELDELEQSVKEATNAAQNAEKAIEELHQ